MVSVSVLLPVYNSERTLEECLESVLSQTFDDFEVIAVDDGSTDATIDVLEKYRRLDGRVRVFRKPHGGIVSALNFGLSFVRGEYVARMDSDDLMHPRRLEEQYRFMEENAEVSICGCLVEVDSIDGELSPGVLRYRDWSNSLVSHDEISREIYVESPIVHPTFFVRAGVFEELGWYREVPWPEDYDFILRAYGEGKKFGKVRKKLLTWRDREDRLVRVDERCKRRGMFRCKAHFFVKHAGKRVENVAIAGTGPSGRLAAAALLEEGGRIAFFVDHRPSPAGREVMGYPAIGFPDGIPVEFLRSRRDVHYVLCVGDADGRRMLLDALEEAGLREGEDYTRFL